MHKEQTSSESFFEKEKIPNDETAKDSKTINKKKATFEKNTESYFSYGFVATVNSHSPSLLHIICGDQLRNEAMKTSKLFCCIETKNPALKNKTLECFKRRKKKKKNMNTKKQKQLSKATTSSNVSVLTASFLVANHIAKAQKPFTIGEELILLLDKDFVVNF